MTGQFGELSDLAWSQVWQVTVVALIVGLLVRLFCRHRPHLAYLLWLLVIIKCLTPPIYSSPTGIFSWAVTRLQTAPPPAAEEQASVWAPTTEHVSSIDEHPFESDSTTVATPIETFLETEAETTFKPPENRLPVTTVLGIIWLCGAVAYAGIVMGMWVRWSLSLRNSTVAADAALVALVAELSQRLGVRRKVRLVVTSKHLGPVVYGLFRPTLLLPELLWSERSTKRIEAILAHELTHVRRGDAPIGLLQLIAQVVWWFHPLIWWANRQTCREKERCCDEEAVARLGCEPGQYAQGLLDVLKLKQRLRPIFAFPGVRPGEITSKRMEEIMEPARRFHRRTPRWCWLVMLAAAALILPGRELVIGQAAETPKADDKEVASTTTEPPPALTLRRVWTGDSDEHPFMISRDGKYLVYIDWSTGDVCILELITGETRNFTNKGRREESYGGAQDVTISPDSKQIAYGWYDRNDEVYELHLVAIDGTGSRVLITNPEYPEPTAWSPDGKKILARWHKKDGTNQIVWVSVADGSVHLIKDVGARWVGNVCVSPDGRYIAYDLKQEGSYSKRNIFLLDTYDNQEIRLLTDLAEAEWSDDRLLGWSPDGNWILFNSDRWGTHDAWLVEVSRGRPHGNPRLVKKNMGYIYSRGFTRDGSFYFAEWSGDPEGIYVARIDFEKGALLESPIPYAKSPEIGPLQMPAWSNDGRYLVYTSWDLKHVFIQSFETKEITKLADLVHVWQPRWSPDDKTIFCSNYRIDAQTGQARPLIDEERIDGNWQSYYLGYGVSPDGKKAFIRQDEPYSKRKRIAVYDLESDAVEEIYSDPNLTSSLSLSPDGRWLLFSTYDAGTGWDSLRIIPSAGGEPHELVRSDPSAWSGYYPDRWFDWYPDSRNVVFLKRRNDRSTFWKISIEGGSAQKVWQYGPRVSYFHVHPDGQHIVFDAQADTVPELWVMENFLPLVATTVRGWAGH